MNGAKGEHYIAYNAPAMLVNVGQKDHSSVDKTQQLEMELIQVKAELKELRLAIGRLSLHQEVTATSAHATSRDPQNPPKPPRPASPKIDIPLTMPLASAPSARYDDGIMMDVQSDGIS